MKTQLEEVNEAIAAGENVLRQLEYVQSNLNKAKTWGIIDMFSDRGLLTSIFKHSRLDDAQNAMNQLRIDLERFNSELSDIKISDNVAQIAMSNGMRFADWFFDGLIVDAVALSRISESQRQVEALGDQVVNALNKLCCLRDALSAPNQR